MNKERILYDSIDLCAQDEQIRLDLFNDFAEENGWSSPAEVPEDLIAEEEDNRQNFDWCNIKRGLHLMLSTGHFIIVGSCQCWDGNKDFGDFIEQLQDLLPYFSKFDGIKIIEKAGHLYIEGQHHDGSCHAEIKKLTNLGYQLAVNNNFERSRKLHNTIFNYNFYSTLPRLTELTDI